MNFLLLTIQSVVCVSCVVVAKRLGVSFGPHSISTNRESDQGALRQVITFRDWDREDARKWFPISFLLVSVIYTGSKSLVRDSGIPVPGLGLTSPLSCSNTSRFPSTPSSRT